jgi:hypothetical protein
MSHVVVVLGACCGRVTGGGGWDGDGLLRQLQGAKESFSAIAMSRVIPAFQTGKAIESID